MNFSFMKFSNHSNKYYSIVATHSFGRDTASIVLISDECQIRNILQPITEQYFDQEDMNFFANLPKSEDLMVHDACDIDSIFNIEPYFGSLRPYEPLMANIGFSPPPEVRVRAVVLCHVEGGETESMVLKGTCARICYKLDREKIEFKRTVSKKLQRTKI